MRVRDREKKREGARHSTILFHTGTTRALATVEGRERAFDHMLMQAGSQVQVGRGLWLPMP